MNEVECAISCLESLISFHCLSEAGNQSWETMKAVALAQQMNSSAGLSCQSCKREHCSRNHSICMMCVRFRGERLDGYDKDIEQNINWSADVN